MPSLAEIQAQIAEQARLTAELQTMLLQEEERIRKEEEERIWKEEEEKRLKEAEEKRLEEVRLAELARKADEDRRRAEEEDRLRKATEESEPNQVDINMAEDCEWSRLSPLSTSWFLLSIAAEPSGQPKASGSRVRSRTPGKKRSAPNVGELPIPCYMCEKKSEPSKCARTG